MVLNFIFFWLKLWRKIMFMKSLTELQLQNNFLGILFVAQV